MLIDWKLRLWVALFSAAASGAGMAIFTVTAHYYGDIPPVVDGTLVWSR